MSEDYDVFAGVEHPAYAAWKKNFAESTSPCVDETVMMNGVRLLRDEVYNPTDATNKQTDTLTCAAIEVWCKGMRKTLTEGQAARYLRGGEFGIDKQTEEMQTHLKNTCVTDLLAVMMPFPMPPLCPPLSGTGIPTSRASRSSACSSLSSRASRI